MEDREYAPSMDSIHTVVEVPLEGELQRFLFWSLPEEQALELWKQLRPSLETLTKRSPFQRYKRQFVLQNFYEELLLRFGNVPLGVLGLTFSEAFCLFFSDGVGLSLSEMASVCGTSAGTIDLRLQRARHHLHRQWHSASWQKADGLLDLHSWSEGYFRELHGLPANRSSTDTPPSLSSNSAATTSNAVRRRIRFSLPSKWEAWASRRWYIRAFVQGFGAAALTSLLIMGLPWLKRSLENFAEQRHELLALGVPEIPGASPTQTMAPGKDDDGGVGPQPQKATIERDQTSPVISSEFSERESAQASNNKVYRIMLRVDAADTAKQKIQELLTELHAAAIEEGALSTDLPGGTLFEVTIPTKGYTALLTQLGKLGTAKVIITQGHQPTPPGRARIKIWLQGM